MAALTHRVCLSLAGLTLLLSACVGSVTPTPIVFDEPLPADPGPDVGGRALQDEIFADGRVTAEEYEQAFRAGVECMRDQDFDVVGPLRYGESRAPVVVAPGWDSSLWLTLYATNTDQPDGVDRFGPVNERCQAQWYYAVEQVYLAQFEPTEAQTQAWVERAWDCMRDKGVEINEPPTLEDAMASVAHGCEPWVEDDGSGP